MAHFAQLDNTNTVIQVLAVHNNVLKDSNGIEQEFLGINFLKSLYGQNTNWKKTSYNTRGGKHYQTLKNITENLSINGIPLSLDQSKSFRKNYAGIGFKYDPQKDAFIPPKEFNSWILNENTCLWESPIPYPQVTVTEEGPSVEYKWNESILNWELIT